MAEFLSLEKGDPDKLEGRVIMYARIKDAEDVTEDGRIFAAYALADKKQILEELGGDADLEQLVKNEADIAALNEHILKFLKLNEHFWKQQNINPDLVRIVEKIVGTSKKMPFYVIQAILDPVLGPMTKKETDVMYVGVCKDEENAVNLFHHAASLYFAKYRQQVPMKEKPAKASAEKIKIYNDINEEERRNYAMKELFMPLMCAVELQIQNTKLSLGDKLVKFFRGSPLESDAQAMYNEIANPGKNHKKLIAAFIGKIDAILQENFEAAAVCRDEIKSLQSVS